MNTVRKRKVRLHPEPGSKWRIKGPDWRYCDDPDCELEHVEWRPFHPIVAERLKGDPRVPS